MEKRETGREGRKEGNSEKGSPRTRFPKISTVHIRRAQHNNVRRDNRLKVDSVPRSGVRIRIIIPYGHIQVILNWFHDAAAGQEKVSPLSLKERLNTKVAQNRQTKHWLERELLTVDFHRAQGHHWFSSERGVSGWVFS
ncbi:hypothetical protein EYF80_012255 [Liparis tanakae]|uniref:Uncharacterized protein n=1 Tax=Liparis tanakae TaxID=230148 RepID=A0A4Z2II92_9TELE|nr:hypothetical protein EYF80_012255 [Liparis tanakae]